MTDRLAVGEVYAWLDGDTLVASWLDLGWGIRITRISEPSTFTLTHVRLVDCWAPELRDDKGVSPSGMAAYDAARNLLGIGARFYLRSTGLSFGRTVGQVWTVDGLDVGARLVELGLAGRTRREQPA